MGGDQRFEELGCQERRVTGEDEHLVHCRERRPGTTDGIARPQCVVLHRDRPAVELVGRFRRGDDDERFGAERQRRLDDPIDHPPTEERMEMLRDRRAHPCPPASGHDDGCELGAGFGHGRHVGWGARIRTWDHGTKTRCLTTWPRPSESGRRVYPAAGPPVPERTRRAAEPRPVGVAGPARARPLTGRSER